MSAKKRILIIDGPLGGGGAERVLIDILRHFDYSRFEVDLAVICRGGALMDEVPPQVNIIELWDGYSLDYKLAYRVSKWFRCNWLFSRKINGSSLRRDYDTEISFLEGMPLKLHALRTTAAKRISWVHADLYAHRYETLQFYKGEEEDAYNKMDVVVNVSKHSEGAFKKRFPKCKADLKLIYNPVDCEKIIRLANHGPEYPDSAPKKISVVSVGRLTDAKNPKLFLQVAKLAKDANLPVYFTWVGDGDLRVPMEALCANLGLTDMVRFVGFLSNPYPLIKSSDVLLVTSRYESFCMVICEAMCLGIPVISTPTSGPTEIIGDNEFGVIAGPEPDDLFEALRNLTESYNKRQEIATRANSRPDAYSIARTLEEIYNLIQA